MIVIYSIFKISSCNMSSITAKLHENLVSGFRELAITVTVVYLNLVKYLSSKEALLKKNWVPTNMRIFTVCPFQIQSFTKFCWAVSNQLRWQFVSVVYLILAKLNPEEKVPANMRIYTQCPSWKQSFTKFCRAVSNQLRWQKTPTKTNNQTYQVKRSDVTRCMGEWRANTTEDGRAE